MARGRPLEVVTEPIDAFRHSGRVSEHLARVLPMALWHEPSPLGRGRTIAAIVAHMRVFSGDDTMRLWGWKAIPPGPGADAARRHPSRSPRTTP